MSTNAGRDADNPVSLFEDATREGKIACFTSADLGNRTKRNDSRRKVRVR
jgi:hypothetical protein